MDIAVGVAERERWLTVRKLLSGRCEGDVPDHARAPLVVVEVKGAASTEQGTSASLCESVSPVEVTASVQGTFHSGGVLGGLLEEGVVPGDGRIESRTLSVSSVAELAAKATQADAESHRWSSGGSGEMTIPSLPAAPAADRVLSSQVGGQEVGEASESVRPVEEFSISISTASPLLVEVSEGASEGVPLGEVAPDAMAPMLPEFLEECVSSVGLAAVVVRGVSAREYFLRIPWSSISDREGSAEVGDAAASVSFRLRSVPSAHQFFKELVVWSGGVSSEVAPREDAAGARSSPPSTMPAPALVSFMSAATAQALRTAGRANGPPVMSHSSSRDSAAIFFQSIPWTSASTEKSPLPR